MKVLFNFLLVTVLFTTQVIAQSLTLDFESGNRSADAAKCWSFPGSSYIKDATVISGLFSLRTGQLSNPASPNGVYSPWMDMVPGEIKFAHKLASALTGSYRKLEVILIKASDLSQTVLYTFNYTAANAQVVQRAVVPVNVAGIYRVYIACSGSGGNTRALIDDFTVPGNYASNPADDCKPLGMVPDVDQDGVPDKDDAYPTDKFRAYNNFLNPGAASSLMFEDLWPAVGDYDFNDLVVNYRLNRVTNAINEIVEVIFESVLKYRGGSFKNGLALEFTGIDPKRIWEVKGSKLSGGVFEVSPEGYELNQRSLNVPVFDDMFRVTVGDTQRIVITFMREGNARNGAFYLKEFTANTFNPYLVVNQNRKKEIHLPDFPPTELASREFFGTVDDNSEPGANRYYKSRNNLPWALNVAEHIPPMKEKIDFIKGYPYFVKWVSSEGATATDWYLDKEGYRVYEVLEK